ncbi:ABC transporter substrate-binding protein, partial [Acinetobacter sp.]
MEIKKIGFVAALTSCVGLAHAEIKIGVVTSSTGPVAMVGIPQKNTVSLLPKTIAGEKVTYISLDDGSDPTASVKAINKLIKENNV